MRQSLIQITFVQSEINNLWDRLTSFFNTSDSKITVDKYFEICEQLGQEPDPKKIPVEWSDLPDIAREAINVFNTLGDRIVADIGYLGKDYSNLAVLIEAHEIEDTILFLEIIYWLDSRVIKQSSESMKRERDKLKKKR